MKDNLHVKVSNEKAGTILLENKPIFYSLCTNIFLYFKSSSPYKSDNFSFTLLFTCKKI